jgi:tRNA(Ile)-lysidine synthase
MAASRNKPSPDLVARVGDFLAARQALAGRLCVGLSGGCDSVVLLHLASRLGLGERLSALHVHHGLSPNADAWADFCAAYCRDLGVSLQLCRVQVANDGGLGLEAAARHARYAAFVECSADILLLAHHRGDQAETVLFNLLRGSGVAGAAGMPVERRLGDRRLLRPLLEFGRRELEEYARQHDLRWIDDESNADLHYARNYLRHQVMPLLGQRFPAAEGALAQAARHFAEADAVLDELADSDWQVAEGDGGTSLAVLRRLSLPRLKNLLRYRLRALGWRAPGAERLDEFARQLLTAGPDRHPELVLADGTLRAAKGRLHWLSQK